MITGTASDINPGNSIAYTDWSVDTLESSELQNWSRSGNLFCISCISVMIYSVKMSHFCLQSNFFLLWQHLIALLLYLL